MIYNDNDKYSNSNKNAVNFNRNCSKYNSSNNYNKDDFNSRGYKYNNYINNRKDNFNIGGNIHNYNTILVRTIFIIKTVALLTI